MSYLLFLVGAAILLGALTLAEIALLRFVARRAGAFDDFTLPESIEAPALPRSTERPRNTQRTRRERVTA